MVLEWLKGATGVFSAGDRGAARSPAQARPPARRVRIQEDAKAAAAARVTREKEKARKDTPRKKNLGWNVFPRTLSPFALSNLI